MTFSLGWNSRDADNRRVNITFTLVRDKPTWVIRRKRNEPREPLAPEPLHWAELFEVLDRHLARGKVSHLDYAKVKRLRPPQ
jgi:hypothetical protein